MYLPKAFRQTDDAVMHALMAQHPLATLVVQLPEAPHVTHMPLQRSVDGTQLHGHVARANPLAKLAHGHAVTAVFHGPQAYISPNWYASKQAGEDQVPTWNYAVVHVSGVVRVIDDEAWLRETLGRMFDAQEQAQPVPWRMAEAAPEFLATLCQRIIGIAIDIEAMSGKFKCSQNRAPDDRAAVASALGVGGHHAMADLVLAGLHPV